MIGKGVIRNWQADTAARTARIAAAAAYSRVSSPVPHRQDAQALAELEAAAESERQANIRENIVNSILSQEGLSQGVISYSTLDVLVKHIVRAIHSGRIPHVKIEY